MPHEFRHRVLEEMKRVTRRKIVVADYNILKNRYHGWLHVSLISHYESRYLARANYGSGKLLNSKGDGF